MLPLSLLPSEGWEKVAGRPDEGSFNAARSLKSDSREQALIRPLGTFSHWLRQREKGLADTASTKQNRRSTAPAISIRS